MKYCSKCGNELLDEAVLCPKCGCMVNEIDKMIIDEKPEQPVEKKTESNEDVSGTIVFLFGILSILFNFLHVWSFIDGYSFTFVAVGVIATSLLGMYLGFKNKKSKGAVAGLVMSIFCAFTSIITVIVFYCIWR